MSFKKIFILFVLFFSLHIVSISQNQFEYNASAEKAFSSAVQLFRKGDYAEALNVFEDLVRQKPIHQRITAAYIMKGKTLQKLERFNESAALLLNFLKMFPETNYLDDAHYTIAIDLMMMRRYEEAAQHFLQCIETTKDLNLSFKCSSLFESIANDRLQIRILQDYHKIITTPNAKDLVRLKLAEKYIIFGNLHLASNLLDDLLSREQKSIYHDRASALKERLTTNFHLKIGVMLPLFKKYFELNPVKTMSEEILGGIIFALEEFKNKFKLSGSVSLEVRDTEKDSSTAVKAMQELSSLDDVIAIIGPLHNNLAKQCAPVAERYGVPMVIPTTSANGIAALGSHIFQASPDYANRGRAMAHYAVKELGFSKVAVLSSAEPAARAMSESFAQEITLLGAKVVAIEFYSKGTSDLSDKFSSLRKAGLSITGKKESGENLEVPVTSIQGLFIPVDDPEEISVIASQLRYFNLETQILGSNEWYDLTQLESNRRYVDGIIFISNIYIDLNNPVYTEHEKIFYNQTKKHSTKYSIIGYDIMQMLLAQINVGAITREKMTSALSAVRDYPGLHSKISFVQRRVNSIIQILKYSKGEIKKISEISLN